MSETEKVRAKVVNGAEKMMANFRFDSFNVKIYVRSMCLSDAKCFIIILGNIT